MRSIILFTAIGLSLTACSAGEWGSALLMLALLLPACFQPADEQMNGAGGGGATAGGGGTSGGTGGGGGTAGGGQTGTGGGSMGYWEACCLPPGDGGHLGTIGTCFCPGTYSCNYGWFNRCGDNTCTNSFVTGPDGGFCSQ